MNYRDLFEELFGNNDDERNIGILLGQVDKGSLTPDSIAMLAKQAAENHRPTQGVMYTTMRAPAKRVEQQPAHIMSYEEMATKLEQGWDSNAQMPLLPLPDTWHSAWEMIVIVEHDDTWSAAYAYMMTLLGRRMEYLVDHASGTATLPVIHAKVLILTKENHLDARLRRLFTRRNESSRTWINLTEENTFLQNKPASPAMVTQRTIDAKEDIPSVLGREIAQSTKQKHVVLCFRPWDRIHGMMTEEWRRGPDGNRDWIVAVSDMDDEEEWPAVSKKLRPFEMTMELTSRIASRERDDKWKNGKISSKTVLLIGMEDAGRILSDNIFKNWVLWIVGAEEMIERRLDMRYGTVVMLTTSGVTARQRSDEQWLGGLGDGTGTILQSSSSRDHEATDYLHIEHGEMVQLIYRLYWASRNVDIGIRVLDALESLVRRPSALCTTLRRMAYQGLLSPGALTPPLQVAGYDVGTSMLLLHRSKPGHGAPTKRVLMLRVLLAVTLTEGYYDLFVSNSMEELLERDSVDSVAEELSWHIGDLLGNLVSEGTTWLATALWSTLIVSGEGILRDVMIQLRERRQDDLSIRWKNSNGGRERIHLSTSLMVSVNERLKQMCQAVGITTSEIAKLVTAKDEGEGERRMSNNPPLTADEKGELYECLLDSFLYSLVWCEAVNKDDEGDDMGFCMRLVVNDCRIAPQGAAIPIIVAKLEELQGEVMFGLCLNLIEMSAGGLMAPSWIYVPTEAVVNWHQSRHGGEETLLEGMGGRM